MPLIKLNKIEKKRVFSLIFCLLLAIGAWLFMALNRKYTYTAETVLIYKDFPQNRAFKALQSDTVDLQIEGTGWQLVFSRLRVNPPSIKVSLEQLNRRNYVLFSDQLRDINSQLESFQKVKMVIPDTLYFDFSKRRNKRVPIKLRSELAFQPGFDVSGDIVLKPNYVNISGPAEEIADIQVWYTDTLRAKNLKADLKSQITLSTTNESNIGIYPSRVGVHVPVDEFTEKTLEIPVQIINNTNFNTVKLIPKKVAVTFLVSLTKYHEVSPDFFSAQVDLNEWKDQKHAQLLVHLKRFPAYCKLVKIVPEKLDYIIEK
ncbi:MAG: YbbR-like domain-containing protein [Pedobacter sp.]|jgi:YbbR domain-containing protein|nr:MAG: YbbR-like domain-containing protein [Pedobacter sp.]